MSRGPCGKSSEGPYDAPMEHLADDIESRLRAVGTVKRAEGEKLYLRSDLDFTGATVTDTRAVVKALDTELALEHDEPDRARRGTVVEAGIRAPPGRDRLPAAPSGARRASRTCRSSSGSCGSRGRGRWSTTSPSTCSGASSIADPDGMAPVMDRWATDDDFWVRRSSLLCELRPIRKGQPLDRFLARADPMLDEREFFIRKAIGWVLREAASGGPTTWRRGWRRARIAPAESRCARR